MIHKIQQFFDSKIRRGIGDPSPAGSRHAAQLATAALLIELTRADFHVNRTEELEVVESLQRYFGLARAETDELVKLARLEADQSVSLFQFTNLVDKHFTQEQKIQVIEMMWRIAYADGKKDKYEEHLVRKIADLLHVTHSQFIRARHTVENEIQADKPTMK